MKPASKRIAAFLTAIFVLPLLLLGVAGHASIVMAQSPGTFTPTGNMTTPRYFHTATRLLNGQVLITGGTGSVVGDSAELYDPPTGVFIAVGPTTLASEGIPTLLNDGRVLIISADRSLGTRAELYDPFTGFFKVTGNRTMAGGSLPTLLDDGRVLIMGGGSSRVRAELYDPSSETFVATNDTPDFPHTATLLTNGKVLIAWSYWNDDVIAFFRGIALYDPSTGTFASTGDTTKDHGEPTATLLMNGKVLIAGGISAELYDPATGTFAATGNMITGRQNHTATLLPDGSVLIAGGHNTGPGYDNLTSAELYDPATRTFRSTGSMAIGRDNHLATPLNNGEVLITGGVQYYSCCAGSRQPGIGVLTSAELYVSSVLVSMPVVTGVRFDRTNVVAGSSYSVDVSGSDLTSETFFDARFTSPGSKLSAVVLNWQRGTAANHDVPTDTASGIWKINGVRAHQIETDHTGNFLPVSATITVSP